MLIGSVLEEKPTLAVSARLIDVQSGRIISSQQVTQFKAEHIFGLVDSLSRLLRASLQSPSSSSGEELKSVADVTTKSPEAYRAYAKGIYLYYNHCPSEASATLSRTIELDNNFAMVYYYLALVQADAGKVASSRET
jgi:hypothetical protein